MRAYWSRKSAQRGLKRSYRIVLRPFVTGIRTLPPRKIIDGAWCRFSHSTVLAQLTAEYVISIRQIQSRLFRFICRIGNSSSVILADRPLIIKPLPVTLAGSCEDISWMVMPRRIPVSPAKRFALGSQSSSGLNYKGFNHR